MQPAVLPFMKKTSSPRSRQASDDRNGTELRRREAVAKQIAEIFDSLPVKEATAVSRNMTDKQLKLLQWAEKQLVIRRLQRECESILVEIEEGESLQILQ